MSQIIIKEREPDKIEGLMLYLKQHGIKCEV